MLRRSFIKISSWGVNGVIGLTTAVPCLRLLLDPLRVWPRSRAGAHRRGAFLRVTPLSALAEGIPSRFTIRADRWDGYIHYPPGPIGSVWLLLDKEESATSEGAAAAPRVRAWQTNCPHLGCGIDYAPQRAMFICPCHASDFDLNGKRLSGPSPRDMDTLECRVSDPDDKGVRWVEVAYQTFRTGVAVKRSTA